MFRDLDAGRGVADVAFGSGIGDEVEDDWTWHKLLLLLLFPFTTPVAFVNSWLTVYWITFAVITYINRREPVAVTLSEEETIFTRFLFHIKAHPVMPGHSQVLSSSLPHQRWTCLQLLQRPFAPGGGGRSLPSSRLE